MPEDVVQAEAEAPAEPEAEASIAAPEPEEADPTPSLAELINDENLDEVLGLEPVQSKLAAVERAATDRAEAKIRSEQRRNLKPEVVSQAATAILQESGLDASNFSRSQQDRLSNLYSVVRQGAAEQLAEQIPQAFFNGYELPQETVADYLDKVNANDVDGSIKTLVDGAVASKVSALEADIEQRVKDDTDKRVKQELEAARENGGLNLPATSRGTNTSNTAIALTSGEIAAMPPAVWTKLPDDVKTTLHANVAQADETRGLETVDVSRLERVAGLAQG